MSGSLLFALTAVAGAGEPPPPTDRGNILVILADDVGVDMIGAYGEGVDLPPTPHLDALAADGVLFRNTWSNPVCSPTRATILTGRYSFRTGIGMIVDPAFIPPGSPFQALQPEETTLPELLDLGTAEGYAHAAIGKWHLGNADVGGADAPNLAGFSHFSGALTNISDYHEWPRTVDGATATSTDYVTSANVDDALAWLSTAPEPWFLYLPLTAAHAPFQPPPAELFTVDVSDASLRSHYKAMVEALDTEIGRLLAGLAPEVAANTTVLFIGDNGTPTSVSVPPFTAAHAKGTLYEGGINVPLIASGPSVVSPGRESDALVNTTDLFATVAELAGVDVATTASELIHDSVSLVPYLEDPEHPPLRSFLFAELFLPNGAPDPTPFQCPPDDTVTCQVDLGYAGPGQGTLSLCGGALFGGNSASLRLVGAPVSTPAWLLWSSSTQPVPFLGETLVTNPPQFILPAATDPAGELNAVLTGGLGEFAIYLQAAFLDPAAQFGVGLSNALKVEMRSADTKAVRDARFKLIRNAHTCAEELYDLQSDPFELDCLLLGGELSAEAKAAYTSLSQHLVDLLTP